jgi:hypothetical protein
MSVSIGCRRSIHASCGVLALSLASGAAHADSNDMEWLGIAYLWAADIELDARDRTLEIDFSDTVENLEMGFQGHVEAQAEDFGGFVDVVFMGVGSNDVRQGIRVNADVDLTAMDLAVVWSPDPEPLTGIEVFGGLRYVDQEVDLVIDPEPPGPPALQTGVDKSYYDLLVGARYAAPINDQWRLVFSGDLSGGDTEGTWSLAGYGVYRTGQHRFYAGYRHLEMDLKGGAGETFSETFSGPAIAYGFAF